MKIIDIILIMVIIIIFGFAAQEHTSISYQIGKGFHKAQIEFMKGYNNDTSDMKGIWRQKQ